VSAFIDSQKAAGFAVELVCRTLGVSRSAHYQRASGQRSARAVRDEPRGPRAQLRGLWVSQDASGVALRRAGVRDAGRDRVKRVMRAHGIRGAPGRAAPTFASCTTPTAPRPIHVQRLRAGPRRPPSPPERGVGRRRLRQRDGRELRRHHQDRADHDRVWGTRTDLELAIVEYLGWFNCDRLHESLGDIRPAEVEALHATKRSEPTPTNIIN
jgi:hypothetical protein